MIAENPNDFQIMLNDLDNKCSKIGLQVNPSQTLVMCSADPQIKITDEKLEKVNTCLYFSNLIPLDKDDQTQEINRRARFDKLRPTLKNNKNKTVGTMRVTSAKLWITNLKPDYEHTRDDTKSKGATNA